MKALIWKAEISKVFNTTLAVEAEYVEAVEVHAYGSTTANEYLCERTSTPMRYRIGWNYTDRVSAIETFGIELVEHLEELL